MAYTTFGGIKGYVKSVGPALVVVEVPDGIQIGTGVPLVLTNAQGQSDPYALTTADLAPAVMAPTNFSVSGKQYVSATFAQGDPNAVTYVDAAGQAGGHHYVIRHWIRPRDTADRRGQHAGGCHGSRQSGYCPVRRDAGHGRLGWH